MRPFVFIFCLAFGITLCEIHPGRQTLTRNFLPGSSPDSGDAVYLAPTEVVTPWRQLDPMTIDCRSVGKRKINRLDLPATKNAITWTGHATDPVAGFLCIGRRLRTNCTRGFFGGDIIGHTEELFTPPISSCYDQRIKYVEHHAEDGSYPDAPCTWMSSMYKEKEVVHIEPHTSEYDPFRDSFKDHSFSKGHCVQAPCLLNTRDGYWFNTSDPTTSCAFGDEVEVKMTTSYTSGTMHNVNFLSLSLHATDFRGSCKLSICEKEGIRLSTNEWVRFTDGITGDIPPCVNKSTAINSMTEESVLRHLVSEYEFSEDYRRCQILKEKLMGEEGVTRSEMSLLQPTVKGLRPVYMHDGNSWLVATANYDILVSPKGSSDKQSVGILGTLFNSTKAVDWMFAKFHNKDLVEGPNGMFWFKGELINPHTWEGGAAAILEEIKVHYHLTKPDDDDSESIINSKEFRFIKGKVAENLASFDHPRNWMLIILGGMMLVLVCFFIYRKIRCSKPPAPSVRYFV